MKRLLLAFVLALVSLPLAAQTGQQGDAGSSKAQGVLPAASVQQLMPSSVFFAGQSATVQIRNSAAFRFPDGKLVLTGLVDTGGYSTSVREKYQFYLITEAALEAGGKHIAPGAYGCGFVGGKFLLMDIGGGDMFQTTTANDSGLKRPRPLQVVSGDSADAFKIYLGREYVTLNRR